MDIGKTLPYARSIQRSVPFELLGPLYLKEVERALIEAGGAPDNIQSLGGVNRKFFAEKLAALLYESGALVTRVLEVEVRADLPLEEQIARAKLNFINSIVINEKNFPRARKDRYSVKMHMHQISREIRSPEIVAHFLNLPVPHRMIDICELYALAAQYPDEQRLVPINALGSVWTDPQTGVSYCPSVYGGRKPGAQRWSHVQFYARDWDGCAYFPTVPADPL